MDSQVSDALFSLNSPIFYIKHIHCQNNSFFFFCAFLPFLGPLPAAYGGSQARGLIGAVAAALRHSHSNAGSKPSLQPTPQLMAIRDPQPTE